MIVAFIKAPIKTSSVEPLFFSQFTAYHLFCRGAIKTVHQLSSALCNGAALHLFSVCVSLWISRLKSCRKWLFSCFIHTNAKRTTLTYVSLMIFSAELPPLSCQRMHDSSFVFIVSSQKVNFNRRVHQQPRRLVFVTSPVNRVTRNRFIDADFICLLAAIFLQYSSNMYVRLPLRNPFVWCS